VEIIEDKNSSRYQISEISPDSVTINHTLYNSSLILSANILITSWRPKDTTDIKDKDWQEIIELDPEIVLLGTGKNFQFIKPEVLQPLHTKNIGVEFMDTPAACRTFVALSSEHRHVVAALIIN
jgi:uncharacterized protein